MMIYLCSERSRGKRRSFLFPRKPALGEERNKNSTHDYPEQRVSCPIHPISLSSVRTILSLVSLLISSLLSPSLPSHQDLLSPLARLVSCRDERDVIVTPLLFHVPIGSMSGSYSTMSQFSLLPHTFLLSILYLLRIHGRSRLTTRSGRRRASFSSKILSP